MKVQEKYKLEFDVPEGYFDSLADRVMNRIEFEDKRESKRKSLTIRFLLPIAAAIIGVGVFVHYFFRTDAIQVSAPQSDYQSDYEANLVIKSSDLTMLFYAQEAPSADASENDIVEVVPDYPCPINLDYEYIY